MQALDPINTMGLHFLDFGSVYSADGREHPITAMTPAYVSDSSQSSSSQPSSSDFYNVPSSSIYAGAGGGAVPSNLTAASFPSWSSLLPSLPSHFGARLAVSVIAIAILLIVVARLLLK